MTFSETLGIGALALAVIAIVVIALQARHSGNSLAEVAKFLADRRVDKVWLDAAEGIGKRVPPGAVDLATAIVDLAGKLLPSEYEKISHDLTSILQMITDGQPNTPSNGDPEAKG